MNTVAEVSRRRLRCKTGVRSFEHYRFKWTPRLCLNNILGMSFSRIIVMYAVLLVERLGKKAVKNILKD